jgi:hypothetical protein
MKAATQVHSPPIAISRFFQIRYAEEGLDTEGIINTMILQEMDPDRVKKEIVFTVNTICKISVK